MSSATVLNGQSSTLASSGHHSHHTHGADFSEITPEKLAIMKLGSSLNEDRDVFSDPGTPSRFGQSHSFSRAEGGSRSLARTTRQVSSAHRRSSSFLHNHRSKMSVELTHQAEGKFFSLIELMTSASKEASSLKEYWARLMSDRESFDREREELMSQIEEVTETLEQRDSQHHHHGRELGERKKEVEKLLIELSAALNNITIEKKKTAERDHELERSRAELSDVRITVSRNQIEHDRVKAELESAFAKLRHVEGERDHAREDSEKYRGELRTFTREHAELKSRNTDLNDRVESSRKEVTTLLGRLTAWEHERDSYLVEKDRLREDLRKVTVRSEETSRELTELTDRYDRLTRESRQLKESIHFVESERDDHSTTIDRLRLELRSKTTSVEDVEARLADILLKYEQSKREVTSRDERLRDVDSELSDIRHRLDRHHEDHRVLIIERDQLKDDLDHERHTSSDRQRQLTTLQETLTRTESTVSEVRSVVVSTTERIKQLEHERDEAKHHHHHLDSEIHQLKERAVLLQAEIRTITEHRDRARGELEDVKRRYEEYTETVNEYKDDSGELEFEIDSLRSMLSEAREQKERAIAARTAADRERDEYVTKYEEKCREMEKYEESQRSHYHSHSHGRSGGGSTTTTRTVHRSGSSFHKNASVDANGNGE